MSKIDKIAERKLQELYLPKNTQDWVDALRAVNIPKIRKLFKKTRDDLPKKYSRLYLESDDKLMLLCHFMRTQYPWFSPEEKKLSQSYINMQQKVADGMTPWDYKIH